MQIALCRKRKLPPGKKQDGFVVLPPEAAYDLVREATIRSPEIVVVEDAGRYFVRTDQQYVGKYIYEEVDMQSADPAPIPHMFGEPLTPHGLTCRGCGLHSNAHGADSSCPGSD